MTGWVWWVEFGLFVGDLVNGWRDEGNWRVVVVGSFGLVGGVVVVGGIVVVGSVVVVGGGMVGVVRVGAVGGVGFVVALSVWYFGFLEFVGFFGYL